MDDFWLKGDLNTVYDGRFLTYKIKNNQYKLTYSWTGTTNSSSLSSKTLEKNRHS